MSFTPPLGMRSPHIQTILSSIGPRRMKVRRQFRKFRESEHAMILDGDNGVRLSGVFNQSTQSQSNKLVILIHGWEGSHDSSYMLSMTTHLLNSGIDVFRLNMRDHGDSHHLNEGVFYSTLLDEVLSALEDLQTRLPYAAYSLGGFSLGGNFALRIAASAHQRAIQLAEVVAFCPVLHAAESNVVLCQPKNWVYGSYFVRKWKKSLLKKNRLFPSYGFDKKLPELKNLNDMNRVLIPTYTPFEKVEDYFDAYAITGTTLANTVCPCHLHFSKDDMIIPFKDVDKLAANEDLQVTVTEYGGHCGFLMNWRFDSWQDQRMLELI